MTIPSLNFQVRDQFLAQFSQNKRSTIANRFLDAVRNGHTTPETVVKVVRQEALKTIKQTREQMERWPSSSSADDRPDRIELFQKLFWETAKQIALDYAAYCLDYEALPQNEKDRLKSRQRDTYIQAHMQSLTPTDAQLSLLRKLGWTGQPTLDNRAEASSMIEAYLARQGQRA